MNTSTKGRKMRADRVKLTDEEASEHFYRMDEIEEKHLMYARTKHQIKKAKIKIESECSTYLREKDLEKFEGSLYRTEIRSND